MVGDAARNARTQLLEGRGLQFFTALPEMLDTRDGIIFHERQPGSRASVDCRVRGHEHHYGPWRLRNGSPKPCFMIAFVEVEVDTDTGDVRIVRIVEGTECRTGH